MADQPRIQGLEALLKAAGDARLPPVERWNPPYCGDIGLRIRGDGTWLYRDSPILRIPLVKLFSRVLRRDADGHTYLVTPVEKIDVHVDDAPFLAVEMQVEGVGRSQQLTFRTNVDDLVTCGPAHPLRFECEDGSDGLKPYVRVRGRLDALITRALVYDLAELTTTDPADSGALGLWSGGAFFAIPAPG